MPFGWLTVDGKIPSFATFPSNRVCLDNTQPSNTHKCSSGRRSRHHDCDARGSKEGVFAAQVGLEEWMAVFTPMCGSLLPTLGRSYQLLGCRSKG
eukprot:scaffold212368_cov15-Tisochrysis_lutea.AAC.1